MFKVWEFKELHHVPARSGEVVKGALPVVL